MKFKNLTLIYSIFIFLLCIDIGSKNGDEDFVKESVTFYAKKEEGSNERIARKGFLVKRRKAPATVLILHGYGINKFDVAPFRLFFKDFNCLTFDFRGHGENIEDQYCTIGHDEVFDLFAAVDFIRSQEDLKNKPIFIWAPSMGASTAIEAQSIDPNLCQGMFLDAPFPSSEEILKKGLEKMKVAILGYEFNIPGSGLLEKYGFHSYVQPVIKFLLKQIAKVDAMKISTFVKPIYPIESIKKVTIPCFFVTCKNDEKIPPEGVKQIFNNHPGIKRYWETGGRHHCDSLWEHPEKYAETVSKFFKDIATGKIYSQEKEIVIYDNEIGGDSK